MHDGVDVLVGHRDLVDHAGDLAPQTADEVRAVATEGLDRGDAARHLARVLRDSADADVAAGYLEEMYRTDVSDLLPNVSAPALVMHYRGDRLIPFSGGQQLAAGLPDARLVALDGPYHLPDARDLDQVVAAVTEFLHG